VLGIWALNNLRVPQIFSDFKNTVLRIVKNGNVITKNGYRLELFKPKLAKITCS
jgi:hypothetical protein